MSRRRRIQTISLLATLLVLVLGGTSNNSKHGSMEGIIIDTQGAPATGALLRLKCISVGVELETRTNANGRYEFEKLPPASDCVVTIPGFSSHATIVLDRIVIQEGKKTVENFQLFPERTEEVIVSAKKDSRRVVDLESVGQVRGQNSRKKKKLTLAAGTVQGNPNVMGARGEEFQAVIDGVSDQDPLGGTFLSNLNTDAIETVEIIVSGADASFRRASGGYSTATLPLGGGKSLLVTFNTESYDPIAENPFRAALRHPLSTFSIDVDTASYSNVRRFLSQGQLPPKDAVRIEELINYFHYDYPAPQGEHPFSVNMEVTGCPWAPDNRLVRVGLKGSEVAARNRPAANLVFLLDVSGSMASRNKLPLVKRSMRLLVNELSPADTVAIVVYAGAAGLVLPATPASDKETILGALRRLNAGGSTAGGEGLKLAYRIARKNFLEGGINRVILATDGDFNVGISDRGSLVRMIKEKAGDGIFFTVLGFGMGNLKDDRLEALADKGNGHYAYIDSLFEARKVLVEEVGATLVTIAKDVKIQVEFNPARVHSYRLIGYENRLLRSEDFNDDRKDAGEIGAGHSVTALYEIVPVGEEIDLPEEDELRYLRPSRLTDVARGDELLVVKIRYKAPDEKISRLLQVPVIDGNGSYGSATPDTKFAVAVASFGMILRDSSERGSFSYEEVERLALDGAGVDERGYRTRFVEMVRLARDIGSSTDQGGSHEEQ